MSRSIPIGDPPITQEWLGIWYAPMEDELSLEFLPLVQRQGLTAWRMVPRDATLDPEQFAQRLLTEYAQRGGKELVYLFVPGRKFDASGTRHGRGGGWYDRFLAALPSDWLKIGVYSATQWSDEKLECQTWDVPMDCLIRGIDSILQT